MRADRRAGEVIAQLGDRAGRAARRAAVDIGLPPELVTLGDLERFLGSRDWRPETCKAARSALRGFFRFLVKSGRLPEDPSAELPVIRVPRAAARPASEARFAVALQHPDERVRLAAALAGAVTPSVPPALPAPVGDGIRALLAAELARGFAALADPARLRILSLLASAEAGEVCACDLVAPVGRAQPTVSHHLKVLSEAGLVVGDKRGRWIWYRVVPQRLAQLRAALA